MRASEFGVQHREGERDLGRWETACCGVNIDSWLLTIRYCLPLSRLLLFHMHMDMDTNRDTYVVGVSSAGASSQLAL
jgi:hypothetical protein